MSASVSVWARPEVGTERRPPPGHKYTLGLHIQRGLDGTDAIDSNCHNSWGVGTKGHAGFNAVVLDRILCTRLIQKLNMEPGRVVMLLVLPFSLSQALKAMRLVPSLELFLGLEGT